MEEEQKYKVVVNLYDLSGGLAKVFSPTFLGKQIEGIWHTGVVVYNKEYYFGGGICSSPSKQTPYGVPVKEIPIGETEIPEEVLNDYLQEISSKYSMEKYDLFNNNCNNFSQDCVHFLCDQNLPSYITGLPSEVLNTPIGQMLKPIIDNMQNQVIQQSGQSGLFPQQFEGANNSQQMFKQQQNNQQQQQQPVFGNYGYQKDMDIEGIQKITDFMEFINATSTNQGCLIYFYTMTCGACHLIKQVLSQVVKENKEISFFSVDGDLLKDISAQFQLQGFPTFVTYFNGEMVSQWMGANQTKLMEKLKELKEKLKQ